MATVTPTRPASTTPPILLPIAEAPRYAVAEGGLALWWIGCHGGAGVSTLLRLTGVGAALGTHWPRVHETWGTQPVVLVARASASGLRAATGAVEQWRAGMVPGVRVVGLVVVAASPKRPPKIVAERMQLLAGWLPALWRVGWVPALLAADDPRDVGVPPDVEALRAALAKIMSGVGANDH